MPVLVFGYALCCHRQAALFRRQKEGGCLRCMRHGLKVGPDGRRIEIPGQGQDKIPERAAAHLFDGQVVTLIWDTNDLGSATFYQNFTPLQSVPEV